MLVTSVAHAAVTSATEAMVLNERRKSIMLRAWILAGTVFLALPGTLLGFSNLMAISAQHGFSALPPAWVEGHGHAQFFGWIGSFILGIGFYSQPARGRSVVRVPSCCFVLWVTAVMMRWIGNIYGWHWRLLLPLSAALELVAVVLFVWAASHHKLPDTKDGNRTYLRVELWMISVLVGTAGLVASVIFNFAECLRLALLGATPSFPHVLDQRYLILLGWGFLVPVVWGFSARWLPTFLGLAKPRNRTFALALIVDIAGVFSGVVGWMSAAALLLAAAAITSTVALRFFERPRAKAKTKGVHATFPLFARIPYVWLIIAGCMSVWAVFADRHGGIWGASRHALTVGFAATMVFAIGPRILPHFGGVYRIFSTRLMFVSLLLLQLGCTLRVLSEPLAYEGIVPFAWKVLPASGVLELSAVLFFAANVALTFALGHAFAANAATPSSAR